MKKWLCTVLAVSMLTGILTGCGSTSGQAEADAPAVESQDTETVADATEVTDDATDAVTDTTDAQETEAQTASEGKTLLYSFRNRQHSSSCADDRRYSRSRSV